MGNGTFFFKFSGGAKVPVTSRLSTSYKAVISKSGAVFATIHDATTGAVGGSSTSVVCAKGPDSNFYIYRMVARFDLAAISGQIKEAILYVNNYSAAPTIDIIVQKCNNSGTLITDDYDNFSGNFGVSSEIITINTYPYFKVILNSDALTELNNKGIISFFVREYSHDYLNIEPTGTSYFGSNSIDHYLDVTY